MRFQFIVAALLIAALTSSVPAAAAQANVTTADIQKLQDNIYEAGRDVRGLRVSDADQSQLEAKLDELRDEVIYLKVKLRKNERVTWAEYADLRDRIAASRTRTRDETRVRDVPEESSSGFEVPAGTEIDVRLQQPLSSETAQPEDRVEATTLVDLRSREGVLIPAGSVVRGVVRSVNRAGRLDRKGSIDLAFDRLTVRGRSYPIYATVTQAIQSEGIKGEVDRIGVGAGIGAVLGGILGGFKGVLAGIAIGAGGVIAATEGEDVELPSGTVLRLRLDSGLNLD